MPIQFDSSVRYSGPKAPAASLSGSPLWALGIEGVLKGAAERGWRKNFGERVPTPYGIGPLMFHFTTPAGRDVIWIPTYGWVNGQDWERHLDSEKAFWILWQAGVTTLLVGGTSGVADWRTGEAALRPGDVVLPWSFRTQTMHRGLPGTEHETIWPKRDVLLDEPFCPALAAPFAKMLGDFSAAGKIGRVITPREARAAILQMNSLTFETDYDILAALAVSKTISEMHPEKPPVVTVHGDCINPILARQLGMHVLYYHMISNYAQGLTGAMGTEDIVSTLYDHYTGSFGAVALEAELTTLESIATPDGTHCKCISSVRTAPEVFSRSMT